MKYLTSKMLGTIFGTIMIIYLVYVGFQEKTSVFFVFSIIVSFWASIIVIDRFEKKIGAELPQLMLRITGIIVCLFFFFVFMLISYLLNKLGLDLNTYQFGLYNLLISS